MNKYCGRCKKLLPPDSEYLICEHCHKKTVMDEQDLDIHNSRVHY
ncbi:MAG TPA: hypothetical protein VJL54_07695 [Nitrososphaera sp.]|nr:hypothetical protein [Nitrososphaera sp.]